MFWSKQGKDCRTKNSVGELRVHTRTQTFAHTPHPPVNPDFRLNDIFRWRSRRMFFRFFDESVRLLSITIKRNNNK